MNINETITTRFFYPKGSPKLRLFALGYFAALITLWTILGHTVLGFEQSGLQPIVAVASACFTHWLLEWVDSRSTRRAPRYGNSLSDRFIFLLPALIPGLAVGMLIYPNELLWPMIFASALSIASKIVFRAPVGQGSQHIFNPSNFGITVTLLLFPWIGLAPPYQFTENVTGLWHWIIPGFILISGIIVHAYFTGRLPLCIAWIGGFLLQAFLRSWYFDIPWIVPLIPMTSAAFILFTLYMIPDPATTPLNPFRQILFGLAVAAVYALLLIENIVFGLFIALFAVCACRGAGLYLIAHRQRLFQNAQLAESAGK
ncbi:RnfABCDGE type electron transport complex subunit D [Methylotuvimicrobium alcaliphilum]|uniref:Enediyne biosynthesis protein UnbU n=1 Tax=Methylotuvimicrobium alcaliphilum (strain DSM 19304 / NCIMB 14124 / VKM B-2133 / 20Z) TaxID=1091494 RepID=G4SZF6_META2|nr:RnfABCDGE type electron transport complex subunit D [Methylotuvimicrobium alcaliphilum]CCE23293.1 enediyne biosynthesis protein UnbU [Methylotuvimicrobium alcaliphilum 20Z]